MTFDDWLDGLSARWFELGVVTTERLAALRAVWARDEEPRPEVYRWRAFAGCLAECRPLSAELAHGLQELAEHEPDRPTGEAMLHALVELPECPQAVLEAARLADREAHGSSLSSELFWIYHGEAGERGEGGLGLAWELAPLFGRPDVLRFLQGVPVKTNRAEVARLAAAYCNANPSTMDEDGGEDPDAAV